MTIAEMAEQIHIRAMSQYLRRHSPHLGIMDVEAYSYNLAAQSVVAARAFYKTECAIHEDEVASDG